MLYLLVCSFRDFALRISNQWDTSRYTYTGIERLELAAKYLIYGLIKLSFGLFMCLLLLLPFFYYKW